MAAELSAELRQALSSTPEGPLEVIDPVTKKAYVLVSADVYQRVRSLLGEDDEAGEMSRLLVDLCPRIGKTPPTTTHQSRESEAR